MKKLSIRGKKEFTVNEAVEHFLRKCTTRNLSPKTLLTYKGRLEGFLNFLGEDAVMSISDIDIGIVDDYTLYLRETGNRSDTTVTSYLRDLKVFLYFCMNDNLLQPFKIKLPKVDKKIKETYTDEELKALLKKPNIKTCDFSEYKIWTLTNYLMATGNRISSALNIKIGDLDFDNALIQVNITKNRKAQIIPMSSILAEVLQEYLIYRKGEASGYLFCNTVGDKGDIRTFQIMLAKYNNSRNVAKTSAHLFRHTFAKKWILNGGDIFRLQKILGHSDLTMVREYVNMFGNEISLDFNRFNPLDNMDCGHSKKKIKMK